MQRAAAIAAGLVTGGLIYSRDWGFLFSTEPFYTADYYSHYVRALLLSLVVGVAVILVFGVRAFEFCLSLLLPSFVLRHSLFLLQFGPTNTWPPAFLLDALLLTIFVLTVAGIGALRSAVLSKWRKSRASSPRA